jgi:hypothetical protein
MPEQVNIELRARSFIRVEGLLVSPAQIAAVVVGEEGEPGFPLMDDGSRLVLNSGAEISLERAQAQELADQLSFLLAPPE